MNTLKQVSVLITVSFSIIANNVFAQEIKSPQKETQKTPIAKSKSEKDQDFTQAEIDELTGGKKNAIGEVK